MQIHLSTANGVPIYVQIVQQVKFLILAGRLAPGEELPPIRVLAERLLINPNTVARAYRELEQLGLVTKRSTAGTFVSDRADGREEAFTALVRKTDDLIREAGRQKVGTDELVELVRQRSRAHTPDGESKR